MDTPSTCLPAEGLKRPTSTAASHSALLGGGFCFSAGFGEQFDLDDHAYRPNTLLPSQDA